MKGRLVSIALAGILMGVLMAGTALAAHHPRAGTQLTLRAETSTVSGRPVGILVELRDDRSQPMPGALIRLVTPVRFMGADREEIVNEGRTDGSGEVRLVFAPTETGPALVTARFAGDPGHGPAEASLTFDVSEAVVVYQPEHAGVGGPWARSYIILLPVAGLLLVYVVVLSQARRIRRAAPSSPSPAQGSGGRTFADRPKGGSDVGKP